MTLSSKQKKIALIVLIVIAGMAVLGGVATGIYFGVATIPVEGVVLEVGNNSFLPDVRHNLCKICAK